MGKSKGEAATAIEVSKSIFDLVERFGRDREAYKKGQYNETQVRLEFINPTSKALGWDIDIEQEYAEAYEDAIWASFDVPAD